MDNLINKINKLSLTNDNLMKRLVILDNNKENNLNNFTSQIVKSINKIKNNTFFYPKVNDTLFWCYIIKMYGIEEYDVNNTNRFSYEKIKKIELIETIRNNKDTLKKLKIKKADIENELVYNSNMSISTFIIIMIINKFNVIYYNDKCYYEMSGIGDKNDLIIINEKNNKYGISMDNEMIKIDDIRNNRLIIENINKPIKAISNYKLAELQHICKKLKIKIVDDNDKKYKKKDLYLFIKEILN
tara:strand:+ start:2272 stop:3000 length:729 start_codon:yes stop_codon:yes gene_type:complete